MLSSRGQPVSCAKGNQPTLELRNGFKEMEHQLARSVGSIDPLLQADQIDISGFEVSDRTIRSSLYTSLTGLDCIIPKACAHDSSHTFC